MADRDKVINGLYEALRVIGNSDSERYMAYSAWAIEDAIEMLKAQEPKSPITSEVQYGDHLRHCPSCGKALPNRGEYGISHYCYKCGQAVK